MQMRTLIFLLLMTNVYAQEKLRLEPVRATPAFQTVDPWSHLKMQVKEAQALVPKDAALVTVAVIDTGIMLKHADLLPFIFQNPGETAQIATVGVDDDRNGFIDDVNGWDFESETNEVTDDFGHGTHVAGIIRSICPKVKLLSVKWMKQGSGWGEDAIEGIHYAVKMGARVINASWGGIGYSKKLEDAVKEAEAQGVVFVASAGNKGTDNDVVPRHPANLKLANVIAVANTGETDALDKTSNYGANSVHIAAPGMNIVSTTDDGRYGAMSGTSMAAAAVSGVAALMIAANPGADSRVIKEVMMKSADPVPALSGKIISGARVNAYNAVLGVRP